jgi:hypothetical protein
VSSSTFEIKGRPRVRSLAAAAGFAVVGMAIMGLTVLFKWDVTFATVGMAVAGVGIGLVLVTQEAARRAGVMARLDDAGFALVSSRTRFGLAWSDVKKVSMAGNQLIIRDAKGQEVKVIAPQGSRPEELDSLAAAMVAKLDASRGYRTGGQV